MKPIYLFREATPLRKLLIERMLTGGGSSATEHTEVGNPLTFLTDLARPLKSCLATWQPHQSGSGDPSPENVRPISGMDGVNVWHTGKNLLDPSKCTKQGRDNLWWYASEGLLLKAGTYTFSFERNVTGFYVYDFNTGTNLRTRYNSATDTFTLAEDHVVKINVYISGEVSIDEKAQLEVGETATAYSPYTPVTTYPVAFPALGKNLLDITQTDAVKPGVSGSTITIENGVISIDAIAASSRTYVVFSQTFPAGTYTIQGKVSGSCNALRLLTSVEIEGSSYNTYYGMYLKAIPSSVGSMTFTLPSAAIIGVNLNNTPGESGEPGSAYDIQLEKGESATPYEPYTNTVYGGSLDLVSGVLTAEWAYVLLNDSSAWASSSGTQDFICNTLLTDRKTFPTSYEGLVCSAFPVKDSANIAYMRWTGATSYKVGIKNKNTSYTLEDIQQMATDGDIAICYRLATPQTFQLTPQQITALIGNNTMWADADDLSVTYLKKG